MLFDVVKSQLGYAKLIDGTTLTIRVTIYDIKEAGKTPVGLDLTLDTKIFVTTESPVELKERVKDKQMSKGSEHLQNLEFWELIDIVNSKPTIEEIRYKGSDNLIYFIAIELELTIVSRNLEYKDKENNPLYKIKWSEKALLRIEGK